MSGDRPYSGEIRPFVWSDLEFDEEPPAPVQPLAVNGDAEDAPEQGEGTAAVAPEVSGEDLLSAARAEAEALLLGARAEAEQVREEARRQGFDEGKQEAEAAVFEVAERLQGLAEELAGHKATLYAEAREQVLELSLALLNKLIGPLLEEDSAVVVRVVERSLKLLSDRETLTIRVNPADFKVLVDAKPQLLETFDGIQKLTVLEDPSVKSGGCLVQTPTTEIDARLDTQLQELARSIRTP